VPVSAGLTRGLLRRWRLVCAPYSRKPIFSLDRPVGNGERQRRVESCAEQIKRVVKKMGLTMAQISSASSLCHGKKTPFFVPPTFLYKQKKQIAPHVCQIVALSEITGYRFTDWMRMCGFDLRLIFSLQLELRTERTMLITPDDAMVTSWLSPPNWNREWRGSRKRYLFARIGTSDVVHPNILRGSIVRVDRTYCLESLPSRWRKDVLWLVEYQGGLTCCRVQRVDQTHIILFPNRSPLPSWPVVLEKEARVLGLVDLQFCPRQEPEPTKYRVPRFDHHPFLPCFGSPTTLSTLLRGSRSLAGLTLREARKLTVTVGELLGNKAYRISLGQLSDYEAGLKLPRNSAKVMSLCIVYGIHPWDLMASAGIQVDDSGKASLDHNERDVNLSMDSQVANPLCEVLQNGFVSTATITDRTSLHRVVA
jgi:hypothetical protein